MISTVIASATRGKEKAIRKTVAEKNVTGPDEISDEKKAAPARKRTPAKRRVASAIRPLERHHLIEVAAYYVAERRGFQEGCCHDDWLQAEREIDAMIAAVKFAG